jgi:hypothetical protein
MYIDSFGRYHDKPTINGQTSSNNAWIYTAYSKRVGLISDLTPDAKKEALYCFAWKVRLREIVTPVISRDECIGLVYLLDPQDTISLYKTWNFSPYKLPKLNIFKLIYELIQCIGEHRNYFWQNDFRQMRHVAFMVPFQDRAFIMRHWGMKVPWHYRLIEWIDKKIQKDNRTSKAIKSFKYGLDQFKGICYYFEVGHPIRDFITKKWTEDGYI